MSARKASASAPIASRKSARPAAKAAGRLAPRPWLAVHALHLGIAVSFVLHAVLAVVHFVPLDPGVRKHQDLGMRVVLVNAKHKKAPDKAQALAQNNLDGGGEQADPALMPSSPLPPQDARDGESLRETRQRQRLLEARQRELLAMAQGSKTQLAPERARQSAEVPTDTQPKERGLDLSTANAIARQEAVVDKKLRDYASRPRKGFISPRTREYKLAMYGEAFRHKIERVGELNFPRNARGAIYGSVMVVVEILPDGSLGSAEIARPSPDPKVNEAALRIVKLAAPYARIPDELRKDYDILVLARTMNFTREDISIGQ